jgi:hypothetical protein
MKRSRLNYLTVRTNSLITNEIFRSAVRPDVYYTA